MTDVERICKALDEDRWHTLSVLADAMDDEGRTVWATGLRWLVRERRQPGFSPYRSDKAYYGEPWWWSVALTKVDTKIPNRLPSCLPRAVWDGYYRTESGAYLAAAQFVGTHIKEHGKCEF